MDEVNRLSRVDKWFLRKIEKLVTLEQRLIACRGDAAAIPGAVQDAFYEGYPSATIQDLLGVSEAELSAARKLLRGDAAPEYAAVIAERDQVLAGLASVKQTRHSQESSLQDQNPTLTAALAIERLKVQPVFKMVDTCAGEFESHTPYYYGTFDQEDDAVP